MAEFTVTIKDAADGVRVDVQPHPSSLCFLGSPAAEAAFQLLDHLASLGYKNTLNVAEPTLHADVPKLRLAGGE